MNVRPSPIHPTIDKIVRGFCPPAAPAPSTEKQLRDSLEKLLYAIEADAMIAFAVGGMSAEAARKCWQHDAPASYKNWLECRKLVGLPLLDTEPEDAPFCVTCNGTGEGQYDGSSCRSCRGRCVA